jgi:hypothetical protein
MMGAGSLATAFYRSEMAVKEQLAINSWGRRSTSNQQNNQDDQQDGAESATDIGTAEVKTAAAEQQHQDDNKDYQVHVARPPGLFRAMNYLGVAIASGGWPGTVIMLVPLPLFISRP